jgi:NADH dehydrogenase
MGWLALHLVYIVGFRSRLSTIIDWAVAFSTWGRSQLTVTEQQVYARTAMDHLHHLEAENKLDDKPAIPAIAEPDPEPTTPGADSTTDADAKDEARATG